MGIHKELLPIVFRILMMLSEIVHIRLIAKLKEGYLFMTGIVILVDMAAVVMEKKKSMSIIQTGIVEEGIE